MLSQSFTANGKGHGSNGKEAGLLGDFKAYTRPNAPFDPICLLNLLWLTVRGLFLDVSAEQLDAVLELVGGIRHLIAVEYDMRREEDDEFAAVFAIRP